MRVFKNFIYNSFFQVLMVILPLITAPYVSRTLGPEASGTYTYTYSIAYFFVLIAMLGLNNYGNRCIAEVRDNEDVLNYTFSSVYYLQCSVALIVIILYLLFSCYFAEDNNYIFYIQGLYVLSSMFDINWFFYGVEEFKTLTIRNSLIKILSMVLIFMIVKKPSDLWKYTFILCFSTLFSQAVMWPFALKKVEFVKVHPKDIYKHLKPNLILLVPALATSIYRILDKVMLGNLSSFSEVSYYDYADKLIMVSLGFSSALTTVTMPAVTNMFANNRNRKEIDNFRDNILEVAMMIECAMSFGLSSISKHFIPMFYGPSYVKSSDVLQGLTIAMFFIAWANVIRTQYLIPEKKDTVYLISVSIGAFLNVAINAILVPKYGALGATVATIFAEGSVAIYQTYMIRNLIDIKRNLLSTIPYMLIGTMMYIFVNLISKNIVYKWSTLFFVVFIGAIFFIICVATYWILTKNSVWKKIVNEINNKKVNDSNN